ncbi:hypothetical protein KGM_213660 [Danaus plexippus plexippus]|uniref:Uncharacterized protein n=1 Tax=Danaus plexippus plexippus TaxID=278856 RepID=A0A212F2L3_DANPL|nr:hypothetical protein KGM_213660 [Danaus plexippus plexippus]
MRACADILIFASCFIYARPDSHRENVTDLNNTSKNLDSLVTCVKNIGLSKCVNAYGVWEAESALKADIQGPGRFRETFPWQRFNISDEELSEKLFNGTNGLLQQRSLEMTLNNNYVLKLGTTSDGVLKIDLVKTDGATTSRTSMKKLTKHFYAIMPLLILPGLLMSAILPFFLPTLKMMTLATGILNNMALTGAVFTLLRNNAFNDRYQKRVIYLNNGYLNDKYPQISSSISNVVVDTGFANSLNEYATDDTKDFRLVGSKPVGVDYQVTPQWLDTINEGDGKIRNVKILGHDGNFFNPLRKEDNLNNDEVFDRNE